MYEFDLPTARWSEIQAKGSLPSARSCPAWAKDNRFIYIQGGYDGIERKSDLYALDLDTYTWTELPCLGTPPSPRYFHSCCLYGGKIVIYGGYSGSDRLADMYTYDFDTNHWSVIDCTRGQVPSGRSSLVAQVHQVCQPTMQCRCKLIFLFLMFETELAIRIRRLQRHQSPE